jgi:hypothetical protein
MLKAYAIRGNAFFDYPGGSEHAAFNQVCFSRGEDPKADLSFTPYIDTVCIGLYIYL